MKWNAAARLSLAVLGLLSMISCATMKDLGNSLSSLVSAKPDAESSSANSASSPAPTSFRPVSATYQAGKVDYSQYRARGVDPRVANIPSTFDHLTGDPENYLRRLVDYLIDNEPDPVVRLKNIHDWIATHISYDAQSYFSHSVPTQSWYLTLETGRAVCQGYAELFSTMLTMAGFQNRIITGYSRGYGYNPLARESIRSNHAWNAVYLTDGWYLTDVTWDSGYVDGSSFHRRYNTSYFLLPPQKMIYSHFPDDVGWQLLSKPLTTGAFLSRPRLDGDFFSFPVSNYETLKRSYEVSGEAAIRIDFGGATTGAGSSVRSGLQSSQNPNAVYLMAQIRDRSGKDLEGTTFVQSTAGAATILLRPNVTGPLVLNLYASRTPSARAYEMIWSTELLVESPATVGFPRAYGPYSADRALLVSPLESPLETGSDVPFKIRVPGATKVAVVAGDSWTFLERDSGDRSLFRGHVRVPAVSEIVIFARFGDSRQYSGLVNFGVH